MVIIEIELTPILGNGTIVADQQYLVYIKENNHNIDGFGPKTNVLSKMTNCLSEKNIIISRND